MRLVESNESLTGEKIAGYKRELFSRLGDNVKTILELGIGTGPNLAYYGGRPSITSVIGVDPNVKMARYAEAAAVAAGLSPAQFKFMPAVPTATFNPSHSLFSFLFFLFSFVLYLCIYNLLVLFREIVLKKVLV